MVSNFRLQSIDKRNIATYVCMNRVVVITKYVPSSDGESIFPKKINHTPVFSNTTIVLMRMRKNNALNAVYDS